MSTPVNANSINSRKRIYADNGAVDSLLPGDIVEYGDTVDPRLAIVIDAKGHSGPYGKSFARVRNLETGKEFGWHRNWFKRDPFRTAVHKRRNPEIAT